MVSDAIERMWRTIWFVDGQNVQDAPDESRRVGNGRDSYFSPSSPSIGSPKDVELAVLGGGKAGGQQQRTKQFFTVSGMTCAACSGTIERALKSTKGVYSAKISLLTERCEVVFDSNILSAKQIVDEIEDVGFEASVSNSGSKGKITLITHETMSAEKRALIYKAVMEHVGVLNVNIAPRTVPPYHDVLEVEFDAKQHDLTGPGGAKPVVWQGSSPSPHVSSASSSTTAASDSLGRFSIRDLVASLKEGYGLHIEQVRNDGDLEVRKAEISHRREQELEQWKRAFLQSLLFTIPIALICWIGPFIPSIHDSLMTPVHRALTVKAFILWLLVTPVQFGFGWRFYRNSYKALKHKSANMDVLVALGSSASYFYSLVVCIMCLSNDHYAGNVFFETSALLISIVLLGRYVENMAKGRTSEALSVLMNLQASTALLLHTNPRSGEVEKEEEIDVNLVQSGDLLMVHRGGKIPVDGVILSSDITSIDESLLTGESMPVTKGLGDPVIGGTINLESPIRIRATGVGSETVLFKIVSLVNDAQNSKAPIQAYADYIGSIFVPCVVLLAFVVFIFWYSLCLGKIIPEDWKGEHENSFLFSFLFSVSVLLISCPCSLGLATPTAVMVGTGVGATLGVLFKGGEPLEITGRASIAIFDKTGTLTQGRPSVEREKSQLYHLDDLKVSEESWWILVGSLAHSSEHLMSRAIAAYAQGKSLGQGGKLEDISPMASSSTSSSLTPPLTPPIVHLEPVHSFLAQSGGGCAGTVKGKRIIIGNARWLQENGITLTRQIEEQMESIQIRGNVAVLVGMDGFLTGVISLSDAIKSESSLTIRALHSRGIEVFLLSGDNSRACRAVGEMVGIPSTHVIAQVTPQEKAEVVRRIQNRGSSLLRPPEEQRRRTHSGSGSGNGNGNAPDSSSPVASPLPGSALLGDESSSSSTVISVLDSSDSDFDSSSSRSIRSTDSPVVIFIGDGVNDAGALAESDVGISIGSGTDIAVETAAVVLMKDDLTDVITAIDLSQATMKRIRRNFTWACIYNLLSIPVAAGVFYPVVHQGLPPILAAACMGLSSISVIGSSLLLKKYKKPILADEAGLAIPTPKNRFAQFFQTNDSNGGTIVDKSGYARVVSNLCEESDDTMISPDPSYTVHPAPISYTSATTSSSSSSSSSRLGLTEPSGIASTSRLSNISSTIPRVSLPSRIPLLPASHIRTPADPVSPPSGYIAPMITRVKTKDELLRNIQ